MQLLFKFIEVRGKKHRGLSNVTSKNCNIRKLEPSIGVHTYYCRRCKKKYPSLRSFYGHLRYCVIKRRVAQEELVQILDNPFEEESIFVANDIDIATCSEHLDGVIEEDIEDVEEFEDLNESNYFN